MGIPSHRCRQMPLMRSIARWCCGWYSMNGRQEHPSASIAANIMQSWSNRKVSHKFKPRRSKARRSSFNALLWDRNPPSYSHAQGYISRCKTAMVCKWWNTSRKVCRHPCAVWATSQQLGPNYRYFPESSKSILPSILGCCTWQCRLETVIGEDTETDSWIANTSRWLGAQH